MVGVSIVIPTLNRPELLKRCLSHLIPYVSAHPECSIIVSDNGNASETREGLAEYLGVVRVVQGPRTSPAANRNCGAAHSIGDLLIFLDDDCIPDPNLIAAYQDAVLNNPEIGVFEGRITAEGTETGFADTAPSNERGGYLWSCNFGIRRELFTSSEDSTNASRFLAWRTLTFIFVSQGKSTDSISSRGQSLSCRREKG